VHRSLVSIAEVHAGGRLISTLMLQKQHTAAKGGVLSFLGARLGGFNERALLATAAARNLAPRSAAKEEFPMKTVLSAPPVAPVPTSMRKLLHQVETALSGLPELDTEFENTFRSVPPNVTRSIDAAARLIETELPGWWWNCGHCALRNGASLYVPGSSQIRVNFPSAGIGPAFVRLLQDPKWGKLFDGGFHCDRAGTVALAMLAVFLEAKIALTLVQREA